MAPSLIYQVMRSSDLPAVLELWSEHSDWGPLTAQNWHDWYDSAPAGPAIASLCRDHTERVVGQTIFAPFQLQVGSRQVLAARISAPILRRDLRSTLRDEGHPIVGMMRTGIEESGRRGVEFLYGLPARAWLPVFRWASRGGLWDFERAEYGCLELALGERPRADQVKNAPLSTVEELASYTDEFTAFWEEARSRLNLSCAVIRTPQVLNFRNGGHLNLAVRQTGELCGYAAIRRQDGLLVDFLARSPVDIPRVLAAIVHHLQLRTGAEAPRFDRLKLLASPQLEVAARELGFRASDFQFAHVCYPLHATVSREEIAPARWYLTAGD